MRNKLSATKCEKETKPGRYNDGGGLYLFVRPDGGKTWTFRWRDRITGKLREKGLGPYGSRDVTLKDARDLAGEYRQMVRDGKDPIAEGRKKRLDAAIAHSLNLTFEDCVDKYVEAHKAGWRNEKHAATWPSSLKTHAKPILALSVADVDTALILKCLEPIWTKKTETATRVRQRIEAVLDWATVRKYRKGDNPARWKGHLDKLLPAPTKLKKVKHLAALHYNDVGAFVTEIRKMDTMSAKAIELQILTATRPGEIVGARWDEFDLDNKVWMIPAERMKANKSHEVPLVGRAVQMLKEIPHISEFVFPNGRDIKRPMTTAAGVKLVKEKRPGYTAHGFRSSFRDWAADCTRFQREVIEHALAHQLRDKVEAAYQRSTVFPKRIKLMEAWAEFCNTVREKDGKVIPIRSKEVEISR